MVFPETAHTDRNIALKAKPRSADADDTDESDDDDFRKNISSVRTSWVDPRSEEIICMESGLEFMAATILAMEQGVIAITAQFGPVWFIRDGEWHHTVFDLCVEYASGRRRLIAVKREDKSGPLEIDLELIRNQDLKYYAHSVELWSEEQITKPAFKRAEYILHARENRNASHVAAVHKALRKAGGRARVFDIVVGHEGMTPASGWDAVWSLIDEGFVVHHHPSADTTGLEFHSFVRIVRS